MQELRRDVLKSVDEKIDQRLGSAVNEVKSMLEEARKSAAQAQAAVSKATAPGGPSVGGPALPKGSAAGTWSPWTPRTLEVKGLCDWAQRFSQGMSSEFAEEYLEKIKEVLGSNGDAIDWRKSVSANRYAYDFKVVIVMKELEDQGEARRRAYAGSSSWTVFGEVDNETAIAVGGRIRGGVRSWGAGIRHTYITTTTHLYISCYMPDSGRSEEEYLKALDDISMTMQKKRGRGRFRKKIIVGGDLDVSMTPNLGDITGAGCPERRARGVNEQDQDSRRSMQMSRRTRIRSRRGVKQHALLADAHDGLRMARR